MKTSHPIVLLTAIALVLSALSLAAWQEPEPPGKWLTRVPDEDRARTNPLAAQPDAAEAGKKLFIQDCSRCHGAYADGVHSYPSLRSPRVRKATDGELAWMLKNGNPYHGMPQWSRLPEEQRWQIIAYIRTLPPTAAAPVQNKSASPPM